MASRGLIFTHASSLAHDPGRLIPGHPERPQRMIAIEEALEAHSRMGCPRIEAAAVGHRELALVHSEELIAAIERLDSAGGGLIDPDTALGEGSLSAALHAAGAACALAGALVGGEADFGFALTRPPGHHAERARAMGFCLFNNIAIAAELAIRDLDAQRVLIIDWDVHHGNGTAEIFYQRADVLYISIHRRPFYPGTGAREEIGAGAGAGYTLNLPVPAGSEGALWLGLLEQEAIPAAESFAPRLILISAGYDAHRRDPLGGCRLESSDYARMATAVRLLSERTGAPVGAILEGGYDLQALGESVLETIAALAGRRRGAD